MDNLSSDPLTALLKVFQDGCPIEDYVEKFLNVPYRALWKESTLKTIFLGGLDEHIYQQMPASDITCSLERYIVHCGSVDLPSLLKRLLTARWLKP